MSCTHESHDAIRADDALWNAQAIPSTGERWEMGDVVLIARNCINCNSTLCREE